MPPGALAQVLCKLPEMKDDNLLVGCDSFADAGVYRVRDDLALVQTLDFFTPVVDDPYAYGQIAAANALSDVYAMGAKPLTVMNIVCFPSRSLGPEVLAEILKGGADKVLEAGALIVGGHSVEDNEPKYGLSVTGTVHPDKLITNSAAKDGDVLVLTKPLGSGLILTAAKAEMAAAGDLLAVEKAMKTLNKDAAEVMAEVGVHAATDITGFGLLGHARELALASGVALEISFGRVPLFSGALRAAGMGLVPAGAYANREYVAEGLANPEAVEERAMDVLCDPQTSGGLLIAVSEEKEKELLAALKGRNVEAASIGRVLNGKAGTITLTP
ncbi:selenide, water dikinase [Dethiobacter alkaliphilus AHT 1]|uniref:Selenide, water dikinase n=2 Tax=Dethiobacter TaxID=427925 RepID=C0GCA1_DETAL|nr:selenide, water dikinase [Dethiobacter alkaliphilus AHT 1]